MAKKNEVAKKESSEVAVVNGVDGMFGTESPQIPIGATLPTISIMRETTAFTMPDGEIAKEVVGNIIYWHNANQYYESEFGDGSDVPTCCSSDGITPDGGEKIQHQSCRGCPMNEFGSGKGGVGKACSNTIRLYVLVEGNVIPCLLKCPPSSLSKKDSLVRWLTNVPNVTAAAGLGNAYPCVQVKLTLHTKDFDSGMSASVLDVETVGVLDTKTEMDKIQKLAALVTNFKRDYLGKLPEMVAADKVEVEGEAPAPAGESAVSDAEVDDLPY